MKLSKIALFIALVLIITSVLCACKTNDVTTNDTNDTVAGTTTFDYGIGLTDEGYIAGLKASDYADNFEYKGIKIPASVFEFDQKSYDEQLNAILGNYDFYEEIKDRAVADKDTVNIDFVGFVDEVAFENGSTEGQGTVVTIGVTNYIDDFLDQLIGHKPGETFDVNVTFPDPYQNDTKLSGKDAVFKVTINYIHGEKEPGLTEEIAKDYGFNTVEELEEDLKNWVYKNSQFQYVNELMDTFKLTETPQAAVDYVVNFYKSYYGNYANIMNTDLDGYVKDYIGYDSFADFVEKNKEGIEYTAIFYTKFQAIAELEGLTVSDEELNNSEYSASVSRYGAKYLKMLYLQEVEVVDFIVNNRQA